MFRVEGGGALNDMSPHPRLAVHARLVRSLTITAYADSVFMFGLSLIVFQAVQCRVSLL